MTALGQFIKICIKRGRTYGCVKLCWENNVRIQWNLKDFVYFMHKLISSDFEVNLMNSFWSWVRPEAFVSLLYSSQTLVLLKLLWSFKGLLGKCDPPCWSPSDGFVFVRLVNQSSERERERGTDKCVSRRRTVLTPQNSKRVLVKTAVKSENISSSCRSEAHEALIKLPVWSGATSWCNISIWTLTLNVKVTCFFFMLIVDLFRVPFVIYFFRLKPIVNVKHDHFKLWVWNFTGRSSDGNQCFFCFFCIYKLWSGS